MICRRLGNYIGIELPKPDLKENEELYKQKIHDFLDYHARLKKKSGPVETGNEVIISLLGFDEQGRPIPFTHNEEFKAIIGKGELIKDVEDTLLGKKAGDSFKVNTMFPPYHPTHPDVPVRFDVELREVHERILPELTDGLIAGMHIKDVFTVEDFENFTRNYVKELQKAEQEEQLYHKVMETLIADSELEVCEEEITKQASIMAADFNRQLLYEIITPEEYLSRTKITQEEFLNSFREKALMSLKYQCIITEIAGKEGISVSDEEIETIGTELATEKNLTLENFLIRHPGGRDKLKADILKKKVVELVIDKANFV